MKRRDFLGLLGGAATWPFVAHAQQHDRMRRIGVLMGVTDDPEGQARVKALKQGLQELGWTDGRNLQIESRFAGADASRIRAFSREEAALVSDQLAEGPLARAWEYFTTAAELRPLGS